jgi:hypothetical protein
VKIQRSERQEGRYAQRLSASRAAQSALRAVGAKAPALAPSSAAMREAIAKIILQKFQQKQAANRLSGTIPASFEGFVV